MARNKRGDDTVSLEIELAKPGAGLGAWLVIAPGTADERRVAVRANAVTIGKEETADVVLDDPAVSRRHCEIWRTGGGVQIRDLGSLNGTYLEGIAVQEAMLPDGVTIQVGETLLRFETGIGEPPRRDFSSGATTRFGDAVGTTEGMRHVFGLLERIAPTDLTVTLMGETGTGKDVLARAIHAASSRRNEPFVVFDGGAVAPTLIESELFGHEKGSFTGAIADKKGLFEAAHGGTLFLDEIGELSLDLQPKLLRALEQRRIMRIGSQHEIQVNVRIVAATNRDLDREVSMGRFREDLYFRLSAALVTVPPLRERREDLRLLIECFASELRGGLQVSEESLMVLQSHDWPGNVRELKNVIAGASAVADGPVLEPRDFVLFTSRRRAPTLDGLPLGGRTLESIEASAIRQTLEKFGGNKSKAARALGIASSTLYEKLKKYGL